MLVSEMHIALDQELDSVNINEEDNILPEQKDFFLNREVTNFVKTTIRNLPSSPESLDDIIKRLLDIETLIEFEVPRDTNIKEDLVVFNMPPNFYYELDVLANTSCNTVSTIQNSIYISKVEFFRDDEDLWDNFSIHVINGVLTLEIFNMSNIKAYENGVLDKYQDYIVKDLIINTVNSMPLNIKVYWQYYNGEFTPNTFIFVQDSPADSISFRYKNASNNKNSDFIEVVLDKFNVDEDTILSYNYCRILSPAKFRRFTRSYFNPSFYYSPIMTLSKNQGYISLKNFIAQGVKLTYIRKPAIIDLSLNSSCDLPTLVHDEIIKLTAQSIKAIINSGNYEKVLTENLKID